MKKLVIPIFILVLITPGFGFPTLSNCPLTKLPDINITTYQYDNASRFLSVIASASEAISYNYTYNDVGNRTSLTEPLGAHNYEYDAIDQLTRATHPTLPEENFTYDTLGNRNPLSTTYDATNRLLEDTDYRYTYDANGNRITREDIDTGEITTYHYNVENQLTQVDLPDGTTVNYYYDGLGRRIEKNAGGGVTRYTYDGMDVLAEYNGTDALIRSYAHGPSIDEPLELSAGLITYYYISDGLGSITTLIDQSGAIVERYRYDSFGNTTILNAAGEEIPESAVGNRYMYTAREYDEETGLYYYRLRYYDPMVGRFLQEDPVGYLLGPNLYTYVNNNPVNYIDPFGLGPKERSYDEIDDGIDPDPLGDAIISGIAFAGYGITKGIIGWVRRPTYWQYYPKNSPTYTSNWLTKGSKFRPPYKTGEPARRALNLPARNPATGLRRIKVSPNEQIVGPRTPAPKPKWGWPKPGTGEEYYRGGSFPD